MDELGMAGSRITSTIHPYTCFSHVPIHGDPLALAVLNLNLLYYMHPTHMYTCTHTQTQTHCDTGTHTHNGHVHTQAHIPAEDH